jgi:hypothetical protein
MLDAWNALVDAPSAIAGIDGGGKHATTRLGKLGSGVVTSSRNLTFDLLLSLTHAGERHQPKCSRKPPSRVPAKAGQFVPSDVEGLATRLKSSAQLLIFYIELAR